MEYEVLDLIAENPETSVRIISDEIGVPKSTVHEVIKEQLLIPFHIQKVHAMSPEDYPARVQYAEWFLGQQEHNPNFLTNVLFSDEAGFCRNGIINSHNLHMWAEENPHAVVQTRYQNRFNINIWAGIVGNHLIGPFVLNNRLDGASYLQFLQENLLDNIPLNIRPQFWFMHDGAPPHYSAIVRDFLNQTCPNRWIGHRGPVA